jgi:hypothetical protein
LNLGKKETFSSEMKRVHDEKKHFERNGTILSAQKCTKMVENGNETTQLHDLDLQQERVFKQALIPCSTTQVFQKRNNTFSNHSHNQIKYQHNDVLMW